MKLREKSGTMAVSEIRSSSLGPVNTIAAGEATWGDVDSQAGVTETTFGNNLANTNNFLSERCSAAYLNFSVADNAASISLYHNSGTMNLNTMPTSRFRLLQDNDHGLHRLYLLLLHLEPHKKREAYW